MSSFRATALLLGFAFLLCASVTTPVEAGSAKDLYKTIKKAVRGEDYDEAGRLASDLAGDPDPEALEHLWKVGYEFGNTPSFYKQVLDLLRGMNGILPYATERFDKGKWTEQVFTCDVMMEVDADEARAILISALEGGNQFVEIASVDGLEKSMHRDAVLPLIKKLEELTKSRKRDVLYYRVGDALFNLTGQDFELIEEWYDWWEPVQSSFDPKQTDTGGDTGVVRKRRGDNPEFGGVPVESKNVCFVIDTSGSMKYVMKDDIPGLASADGSDSGRGSGGGDMTQEDRRLAQFWTRMEMAKRELIKCIREMDGGTMFNVVRFDTTTVKYKKKALPASRGNQKSSRKWIDGIKWKESGNTNTLEALEYAFNQDPNTNTIFFLSDGLPSKDGKSNDPTGPILEKVFEMNRFRKIKIFTFGFDERRYSSGQVYPPLKEANDWLTKLAEETGGKFTRLTVDTKYTPDDPFGEKKKGKKKIESVTAP